MNIEHLKYPIGKFVFPENITQEALRNYISTIEQFPKQLKELVHRLSESQLDTPYRPEGWTIRQVIHHCADSHLNSYIRYKWALTEENPTIKAYFEERWAMLDDYKLPVDSSLAIIEGLHHRWTSLMKGFTEAEWAKTFVHPETKRVLRLDVTTALYDWHCKHHLGHIQLVL